MICQQCGFKNASDAQQCVVCDVPLRRADPPRGGVAVASRPAASPSAQVFSPPTAAPARAGGRLYPMAAFAGRVLIVLGWVVLVLGVLGGLLSATALGTIGNEFGSSGAGGGAGFITFIFFVVASIVSASFCWAGGYAVLLLCATEENTRR